MPWLRPLVLFGAQLFLIGVMGHEQNYTLRCGVLIGHVGVAVEALRHALGESSGEGATVGLPHAGAMGSPDMKRSSPCLRS